MLFSQSLSYIINHKSIDLNKDNNLYFINQNNFQNQSNMKSLNISQSVSNLQLISMSNREVSMIKYKPENKKQPILAVHAVKVTQALTYLFLSMKNGKLEIVQVKDYQFKFLKIIQFSQLQYVSYQMQENTIKLYLVTVDGVLYRSLLEAFINGVKPKPILKLQMIEENPIMDLATWKEKNSQLEACIFRKNDIHILTKKYRQKSIKLPSTLRAVAIQRERNMLYRKIALFFTDNKLPIIFTDNDFIQGLISQQSIKETEWLTNLQNIINLRDEYMLEDQQIPEQIKQVRICQNKLFIATDEMFTSFLIKTVEVKLDGFILAPQKIFSIRLNSPFVSMTAFAQQNIVVFLTKQKIQLLNYQKKNKVGPSMKQTQKKLFTYIQPYKITQEDISMILGPIKQSNSNSIYLVTKTN